MYARDPLAILSLARIGLMRMYILLLDKIARYIVSLSCQTCDSLGVFNRSAFNIEVKIEEGEDSLSKLRQAFLIVLNSHPGCSVAD